MIDKRFNTDDNTRIFLKENDKVIGAIQTIEPIDNGLQVYRAVFDMTKTSNDNIKALIFSISLYEDGKTEDLGNFKVDGNPIVFLAENFAILNDAKIKVNRPLEEI